jgi:hypothetical protein
MMRKLVDEPRLESFQRNRPVANPYAFAIQIHLIRRRRGVPSPRERFPERADGEAAPTPVARRDWEWQREMGRHLCRQRC